MRLLYYGTTHSHNIMSANKHFKLKSANTSHTDFTEEKKVTQKTETKILPEPGLVSSLHAKIEKLQLALCEAIEVNESVRMG